VVSSRSRRCLHWRDIEAIAEDGVLIDRHVLDGTDVAAFQLRSWNAALIGVRAGLRRAGIHRRTIGWNRHGALAAVLGGLDALFFTAGVGEHNAFVRERVCHDLGFLGVELDAAANAENAFVISSPASRVLVGVEPTNEEWIAARHAQHQLGLERTG